MSPALRFVFCAICLSFLSSFSFGQGISSSTFLLDGFEDGNFWKTAADSKLEWTSANMALECSLSTEWSSEGKTSACLTFAPMNKVHQSTYVCTELFEPDWGKYREILVDFNNTTDQKISVNIAFQNRETWEWTVCKSATLEKGENRDIRFSLSENLRDDKNRKSEPLEAGNELYCALIQVIGNNKGGTLYVDNIRLVK